MWVAQLEPGELLTRRPGNLATWQPGVAFIHILESQTNASICNSFAAIQKTCHAQPQRHFSWTATPPTHTRTRMWCAGWASGGQRCMSIKALPVPPNWIYATFMCRCKFVELRRSETRAKNHQDNERRRELGAGRVGWSSGSEAISWARNSTWNLAENNCKLLLLWVPTTFEDLKWNYAKTFGRSNANFLKRSACHECAERLGAFLLRFLRCGTHNLQLVPVDS